MDKKSANIYGTILEIIYVDNSKEIVYPDQHNALEWLEALCADPVIASVIPRPATKAEFDEHNNFAKNMIDMFAKLEVDKNLIQLEQSFNQEDLKNHFL